MILVIGKERQACGEGRCLKQDQCQILIVLLNFHLGEAPLQMLLYRKVLT